MSTGQIIGLVLILTALLDVVLGLVVVGPRIANAGSRRVVTMALVVGAVVLGSLGIAFFSGALRAP